MEIQSEVLMHIFWDAGCHSRGCLTTFYWFQYVPCWSTSGNCLEETQSIQNKQSVTFCTFEILPQTLIPKQEAALFLESGRNQTNRCLVLAFVLLMHLQCSPSEVPTQWQLLSAPGAHQPDPLHNLPHKLFPCHYSYLWAFFQPQTIIQWIDMTLATRPHRHQSLDQHEWHLTLSCGLRGSVEWREAARGLSTSCHVELKGKI